jgi:hypothetical protein
VACIFDSFDNKSVVVTLVVFIVSRYILPYDTSHVESPNREKYQVDPS